MTCWSSWMDATAQRPSCGAIRNALNIQKDPEEMKATRNAQPPSSKQAQQAQMRSRRLAMREIRAKLAELEGQGRQKRQAEAQRIAADRDSIRV